jgi:amino acid adenylation domain-containing protein
MAFTLSVSTGCIDNENADKTFVDILRQQAQRIPQRPAVVYRNIVLTFAELDAMSDAIAAELIRRGVHCGDRIGICPSRTEILPLCIFGVFKAGAAYVPLDPNYPAKRLLYMTGNAGIRVVLSEEKFFDRFTDYTGTVIDARQAVRQRVTESIEFPVVTPDDVSAVVYTSGSTGIPKGAQLHHGGFIGSATNYKNLHKITQEDVVSAYIGFSFVANHMEYYPAILAGAALHFIDDSIRLDPRAVNRYFDDNNVTVALLPTALGYRFITQVKNSSLRFVTLAGERFIPIESSQSSFKIFNAYGTTECTSYISTTQILPGQHTITVGNAVDNVEIYIVNEKNELVPIGESGELCVAGRQISSGYLNLPEKTAQVFVKNPFNNSPDYARVYRTGDVARINEDGQIEIRGRLDHQVKVRGFRVEPGEIDTAALQCPGIAEAVTVTVPSPDGENRLVIYVSSPDKVDPKKLQYFIGEALPPYMVPAMVKQLDKLPRNFSGKIDRAALPAVEMSAAVDTDDLPQTDKEKNIAAVAAKVLKVPVESIGVQTNLFDFGLDSLLVFDFILELQKQFHINISSEQITQNPTIGGLALVSSDSAMETLLLPDSVREFEKNADALYPLTFHQKSLLENYFQDPNNTRDNISLQHEFSKTTNVERLATAARTAISAHPLLSARLVKNGDTYAWKRNNAPTITVGIAEISNEELAQKVKTFTRPFNPTADEPLFRVEIYKTPSLVKLFFGIHHLVFDGFSQKILLNEIVDAYHGQTIAAENPTALIAGLLEQEQVVSADINEKCDEIIDRIRQYGGVTKLAEQKQLDKPAGHAKFHEGKPLSAKVVNAFCKEYEVTPNSIFASAFAAVAARHGGKKDALLAFIVSGRDQINVNMVGAFLKAGHIVVRYNTNKSLLENCRTAQEDIKLFAQYSSTARLKYIKKSQQKDWPDFRESMLYIFHGNLLDEDLLPVVEGQKITRSHVVVEGRKITRSHIPLSDVGNDSIPFIPFEFTVGETKGKYPLICKYNDALYDEQFIVQFITEIRTHIEQLLAGKYKDRDTLSAFRRTT